MAIRQFTQEIGIKPAGQGISEFSTSLPTPDFSGVRRFASELSSIGEDMMKADAKQVAEDAANGTQIVKNDEGFYERIKAPESFGTYARSVFDQAVDQNYVNTVYRDTESELNTIASQRSIPPEQRIAQMDAHIAGVLKNIDPKFVGVLGPILGRERNQRQGSILNLAQSQSTAALEASLNNAVNASMDSFVNQVAVGDMVGAKVSEDNIINSKRSQLQLSTQDPKVIEAELKRIQDSINGLRYLAPILDEVKKGVNEETILPEELGTLIQMMNVGEAPSGATAFGITDRDLVANVPEPALKQMRGTFENIYKNYLEKFKQSISTKKAKEFITLFTQSNISHLPPEYNDTDVYNASVEFVRQSGRESDLVNPDIFSPQAIREIGYAFNGIIPEKAYDNFFKDAWQQDPSTEEGKAYFTKRIFAYETLGSITTKSGMIKDATDVINNTDRNFFRLVLAGTKNNKSLETAVLNAKAAIKNGIAMDDGARKTMVFQKYREKKNEDPTETKVLQSVSDNFDVIRLPQKARNNIIESMAMSIAQGVDYDIAAKDAALEFERNWKRSSAVISTEGGIAQDWIPSADALPLVSDPVSKKSTDAYIDGYVNRILPTANMDFLKPYGIDTSNLKFRENVFLEPTNLKGQNTYFLTYYNKEQNIWFRLRDSNTDAIKISPSNAAKKYDTYLVERNLQSTLKTRAGEKQVGPNIYFETQPSQEEVASILKDPIKEFDYNIDDVKPSEALNAWMGRGAKTITPQVQGYIDMVNESLKSNDAEDLQQFAIKTLGFESGGFDPKAKNPLSSAFGIGQMTDETWAIYGRGDRNDPKAQIDAAIRYMKDIKARFIKYIGPKPTNSQLYVLYQQGPTGGVALLSRPNMKAVDVLTSVYGGNRQKAVKAIQNNLRGNLRFTSGNILAKDFTKIIGSYVGD